MSTLNKLIKLRSIKRALEIRPNENACYQISGRVRKFRSYKSFNFIDLVDGSTSRHVQTIVKKDLLDKPEIGAYLSCQGKLVQSPGAKQDIEFKVNKVDYLGTCDPFTYPLATSDELPINSIRKYPHLRPRAPQFASLLRIRSEIEFSLHMIMRQMDFFRVHTPILTSNDSEASSDLFTVKRTKLQSQPTGTHSHDDDDDDDNNNDLLVDPYTNQQQLQQDNEIPEQRIVRDDYFNKDVFLITSAQLHLESLAASLSRVYTSSNAFRAENSLTKRHLCEFLMFEAEEANLSELEPLMNRVETIVKFIAQYLAEVSEHRSDFASLLESNSNGDIFTGLILKPFIRMSYSEALEILGSKTNFSGSTDYGSDIGRLQERMLLDHCNNVPIFITNYPKHLKPFYMKCDANDKEAQCFDLIAPHGGEICGGSLREDSLEKLKSNLRVALTKVTQAPAEHQPILSREERFNWYLDSRRFGSFPHGGFGVGFERLVQTLLGIKNIRDTTGFPRWAGHCPM